MQFYETRFGRKFFEGDMPRLIRAIESVGESMAKIAEKMDSADAGAGQGLAGKEPLDAFDAVSFLIENDTLDKAADIAGSDDDGRLFRIITEAIDSDADGKAARLVRDYSEADTEKRRVIDGFFVDLCGWSFASLLEAYAKQEGCDEPHNGPGE